MDQRYGTDICSCIEDAFGYLKKCGGRQSLLRSKRGGSSYLCQWFPSWGLKLSKGSQHRKEEKQHSSATSAEMIGQLVNRQINQQHI